MLKSQDPKLLVSKTHIYIFYIETRKDKEDQFSVSVVGGENEEDLNQERIDLIDSLNHIQIKDIQSFALADIEFIQKQ